MRAKFLITVFVLLTFFSWSPTFAEDFDLRNTYAVVWTVDTADDTLFKNTIAAQAAKIVELWQTGILENVYFNYKDADKEIVLGDTSKVIFFIKAETESTAMKILDEMPFIKKKVAKYVLHPVGILWLKQY